MAQMQEKNEELVKKLKKIETASLQLNSSNCKVRAQSKNYELVI